MVVMEKCKISDVSTLTEQNITDEEKTAAAAAGTEGQRSRWEGASGHSGAELSSPEAVGALRRALHHQGRSSGLSGGETCKPNAWRIWERRSFLDMFEDEYRSMTSKPLNVEYLMMDASILLPPDRNAR
ncbi:Protein CLEC16A [Bagarius yarrelli]|uniref:Protein CLEC16A n=1 Tax=Bagarius yarrelli TaxID=175774 RepID=A0A556VWZ1_BAGYA|nr:Protein CLEC16A [Bagarius yarrelli]